MQIHTLSKIAASLLLCGLAAQAQAQTVVLNSYPADDQPFGWPSQLGDTLSGHQNLAIPFALSSATSIQSILTSIDGVNGGVTLGILTRQGAVPTSATWLYSLRLEEPWANTLLTPTGWTLAAGDYWLAAVADSGFTGQWQSGTETATADWASSLNGTWQAVTSQHLGLPAARITVAAAIPEPATYGLMLAGGLLVAAAARRRQSNASQQG